MIFNESCLLHFAGGFSATFIIDMVKYVKCGALFCENTRKWQRKCIVKSEIICKKTIDFIIKI